MYVSNVHRHHDGKNTGKEETKPPNILTSALAGGKYAVSSYDHFTSGETSPESIVQEAG